MTSTPEDAIASGCPVVDIDYRLHRPAFWHFNSLNEVREQARVSMNTVPHTFWMLNRYDDVREALQRPEVFTNRVTSALQDPATKVKLIPQNASRPRAREVSPGPQPVVLARLGQAHRADGAGARAEMIEELAPRGSCDLAVDFAMLYPTEVFLAILGLPTEDGRLLLPLVEGVFRGFFGGDRRGDGARTSRSCTPTTRPPSTIVSPHHGTPRPTSSPTCCRPSPTVRRCRTRTCMTLCFTIMLAGLDTTRSELGYIFHHLATHESDRPDC